MVQKLTRLSEMNCSATMFTTWKKLPDSMQNITGTCKLK